MFGRPHGSHGSVATVTVVHVPEQEREAVAEEVIRHWPRSCYATKLFLSR